MTKTQAPAVKEMDHAARKHHPFSPSKLEYLEASPAFESRDEASAASEAGTLQHEAVDAPDLDKFADEHGMTDEQVEMVRFCRAEKDDVKHQLAELAGCRVEDLLVITEERVAVDDEVLPDGTKHTSAGFLDFAVVSPCKRFAALVDWKFGQWKVSEASENLQGIAYLLGLVRRFPTLEAVYVEFFMPYLGPWTSSHVFRSEEFPGLYARVCRAVLTALANRGKTENCEARPLTCSFCANLASCTLAGGLFGMVTSKLNDKLEEPPQLNALLIKNPEDGAKLMKFARVAGSWAEGVRRQLSLLASDNEAFIPEGYVLRVQNDRLLKDQDRMVELLQSLGVPADAVDAARKLGLTDSEKLLKSILPRGEKEARTKEVFKQAEADGIIGREPETKIFLQAQRTKLDE